MGVNRRRWIAGATGALACAAFPSEARASTPGHFGRMAPVVAHRGGAKLAPENTLAAFAAAITRGDKAIECDLQVTKDGKLVAFHDRTLQRTTNGKGTISRTDSKKLMHLDAGRWKAKRFHGEHPPRLEDVLDLAAGRASVFLELKHGRRLVKRLQKIIEARPHQWGEIALISFESDMLMQASQHIPQLPRMYLRRRPMFGRYGERSIRKAAEADATYIGFEDPGIFPDIVSRSHDAGLGVYAFTVNDRRRAQTLRTMGVDGIITDNPTAIQSALGEVELMTSLRSGPR